MQSLGLGVIVGSGLIAPLLSILVMDKELVVESTNTFLAIGLAFVIMGCAKEVVGAIKKK